MLKRLLGVQLLIASLGAAVLICGMLLDLHWLAAAGLAASAGSELLGLVALKLPPGSPAIRLVQGLCQALPSIAVAAVLPGALLVVVAVVINGVMAGGVEGVLISRNQGMQMGGDRLRRGLLGVASLGVLAAAALHLGLFSPGVIGGTSALQVLQVSIGWAAWAALIVGLDATLALRRR